MGVSSGELSNSYLSFTFSRFGLSHLLAISGFHFAILLLFLNVLLTPILSLKIKTICLIVGISAFYLFVGSGPSLARAWIVALVYLSGSFLEKRASAINTLSLSLFLILILDPLMITHLGFQYSFLVTYAILLYTPKMNRWLNLLLKPKYKWEERFLKVCALSLSVHLAAIPLTLYFFHKFYWLSFVFNLFIPLLVSGLIILFLLALLIYPINHLVGQLIFNLDAYLTGKLLDFIFWVPTTLDYCMRVSSFPKLLLFLYLILFFVIGLSNRVRIPQESLSNPLGFETSRI